MTADTVPNPKPARQHRFHVLDAVRGVAAVLVVLFHVPTPLRLWVPQSFLAVDLFFVLSGFVIGYSYEERLRDGMSLGTFTLARVIRLYPLYLLGTLLGVGNIFLHAAYFHDHNLGSRLPMLLPGLFFLPHVFSRALDPQLYPFNMPAWSLFFELIANFVYALLVRLRAAVTLVMVGVAAGSLITLIAMNGSVNGGWTFPTFLPGLLRVGYSFFAGILLYRLHRAGVRVQVRGAAAWLLALGLVATVALCVMMPIATAHAQQFGYLVADLIFPAVVFLGAGCELDIRWEPLCSFLGDLSYPLYAIHYPALFVLVVLEHLKRPALSAIAGPLFVVILIPVSWWIGRHVDLPVRRYLTALTQAARPARSIA